MDGLTMRNMMKMLLAFSILMAACSTVEDPGASDGGRATNGRGPDADVCSLACSDCAPGTATHSVCIDACYKGVPGPWCPVDAGADPCVLACWECHPGGPGHTVCLENCAAGGDPAGWCE